MTDELLQGRDLDRVVWDRLLPLIRHALEQQQPSERDQFEAAIRDGQVTIRPQFTWTVVVAGLPLLSVDVVELDPDGVLRRSILTGFLEGRSEGPS